MKKRLLLLCLLPVLLLNGCGEENKYDVNKLNTGDVLVDIGCNSLHNYYICYDSKTKVEYIRSAEGILSPLYNADGTLKLYKGE
jgi:hypothetical protein